MPRKAKTGDTIGSYRIEKELNAGAMAVAYKARCGDETVFFKQYKSPTPTVPWYRKYVDYQQELKRRIESTAAKNFSYRFVEFFEGHFGGKNFFQVFEWVEGGRDLEHLLEEARSTGAMSWTQRLTLAKVMMAGINAIHEAGIIHCDLKPPNIYLFHDPDIEAGYRLKVIDMDFSILSDVPAPWHGTDTGYVGTPRYFSPEHLNSQVPCQASDVFTCGIILYELLTGEHPYGDESAYAASVAGWKAKPPTLLGQICDSEDLTDKARQLLHLSLHPDKKVRPSAKDINLALRGRFTESIAYPPSSGPAPARSPEYRPSSPKESTPGSGSSTTPPPPPPPPLPPPERRFQSLELAADGGKAFVCGIRTDVGKHICISLGEDAKFMHDTRQFSLVPDDSTHNWILEPNTAAKNQTLVNGRAVTCPVVLAHGDVVGVGNEAKKIVKLPLTVRLREGDGSRKLEIPAFDGWSDDPVRAAGFLQQAEEFLDGGRYDRALEYVEKAISADWNGSNPSTRPYYVLRAAVRAAQGSPTEQQALAKYNLAHDAARRRAYPESRQLYLEAIKLDGFFLWSANNLAWIEATCRDEAGRNGPEALKHALLTCDASKWHCWAFIDTLAAAYAECGNFANAITCVERAIQLAPPAELATLQASIAGYRQKQPFRVT